MSPSSLRDARAQLGSPGKPMTQHGLAKALRMGKWGWQTISGWETGAKPIPGPIGLLIEKLLAERAKEDES